MHHIFVSYTRKVSASLEHYIATNAANHGIDAYVDTQRDGLDSFPERLLRAIETADVFVCLLGEGTLESEWVRKEIEHAYNLRKPMIPVLQEDFNLPAPPVPAPIQHLLDQEGVLWFDKRGVFFEASLEKLVKLVRMAPSRQKDRRVPWAIIAVLVFVVGGIFLLSSVINGDRLFQPQTLLPRVAGYTETSLNYFTQVVYRRTLSQLSPLPIPLEDLLSAENTGIEDWRDYYNVDGTGVNVGVIDLFFDGLADFEAEAGIQVERFGGLADPATQENSEDGFTSTHGTDVLRIIHEIAPGAKLYACEYDGSFEQFAACTRTFGGRNVQIINHSAGIAGLPEGNRWTAEAERVVRAGALWVNAAGNVQQGYITERLHPVVDTADGLQYHAFASFEGTTSLRIPAANHPYGRVTLTWTSGSESVSASATDLKIIVTDPEGNVLGESVQKQRGHEDDEALDFLDVPMLEAFQIRVLVIDGTTTGIQIKLFVEFAAFEQNTQTGSVVAPGDSPLVLTVGALRGSVVAPYSSRGAGAAVKPDLVVIGDVELPNGRSFVGTSAAAPIVAGAAALVWEAWQADKLLDRVGIPLDGQTLRAYLLSQMIRDAGTPGLDTEFGDGSLYLNFSN